MNCPLCGCLTARLVESFRELELGPNDELIQKYTIHFYQQCDNPGCLYAETKEVEVEETRLPYYAVFT